MGWAERRNIVAQSARRGALAPKPKRQGDHFKRPDLAALWRAFDDRVGVRFGKTGRAKLIAKAEGR